MTHLDTKIVAVSYLIVLYVIVSAIVRMANSMAKNGGIYMIFRYQKCIHVFCVLYARLVFFNISNAYKNNACITFSVQFFYA